MQKSRFPGWKAALLITFRIAHRLQIGASQGNETVTNCHALKMRAAENELTEFITNYEKCARFLEDEKWVKGLCNEGKLDSAIERARNFGEAGQSYSNIYKAFDIFGYKKR